MSIGKVLAVVNLFVCIVLFYAPSSVAQSKFSSTKVDVSFLSFIKQNAPDDFNKFVASLGDAPQTNDTNKAAAMLGQFINQEFDKYAPHATKQALFDCVKIRHELYNVAYKINPALVVAIDAGTDRPDIKNQQQNNEISALTTQNLNCEIATIEAAINTPQYALTTAEKNQAQQIINQLGLQLGKTYTNKVVQKALANHADPSLSPEIAAKIIVEFYNGLEALGEDKAAMVFKFMISEH